MMDEDYLKEIEIQNEKKQQEKEKEILHPPAASKQLGSIDAACESVQEGGKRGKMAHDKHITHGDTACTACSDSLPSTDTPAAAQPPPRSQPQLYHFGSEREESYFALRHLQHVPATDTSSATSTDSSPSQSVNASSTSVHLPYGHTNITSQPISDLDGPLDVSRASRESQSSETRASTSTTLGHTTEARLLQGSFPSPSNNQIKRARDYPVYPNQPFSVPYSQFHLPPHLPRPLRTRSSHPSQHTSYSACTSPRPASDNRVMGPLGTIGPLGSKTAGNTPASSPGLFTPPGSAPLERVISDDGSYTSPFLHYTHKQQPKETHKAEIDRHPVSGRKLINQYEMVDEIGRGSHGKVKLGRELKSNPDPKESNTVAIKIVGRYSKKRRLGKLGNPEDNVKKEVAILKKARHPHVVALLEVIDDPDKAKVYLILEYVELGEIVWRTKGVKEVVLIERKRFARASLGLEESAYTNAEDERLIKIAQSRRRFEERRKHKPDATQEYWSLEYGGESEDDPYSEGHSAAGIGSTGLEGGNTLFPGMIGILPDSSHPAVPPSQQLEVGPIDSDNEDDAPSIRQSHPPGSVFEGRSIASSAAALEGSMHGNYPPEQSRDRTPSIVDSLISYPSTDAANDPFEEEYSYVPTLTIQRARQAFRDTMLGLEFLHYQGIIHRDIKPANLLWTKEHVVKISDFGVSYLGKPLRENEKGDEVSESDATTLDEAVELAKTVGTPAFYAPELCYTDLTAPRPSVTGQIDVWALGVTLYCILFARVPFLAADEFSMFKSISEDEVIIPRKRLLAVDIPPQSTSTSSHIREPTDLRYEEIDDDLYDLLSRLLIKDPAKRITLKEIKFHPWVLHGIKDPETWLEETDPSRQSHGKRIEVSNEEVAEAVVPLTLIGRMRSNIRKTLGNLGIVKREGRKRAKSGSKSGFTSEEGQPSPSISASRSIRDERRSSLRGDEAITLALKGSRDPSKESEHPLAQSVTASPEVAKGPSFFNAPQSGFETNLGAVDTALPGGFYSGITLSRPNPPERALSATSTADSTKTVVPYKPNGMLAKTPPSLSPGLPGTPIAIDTAGVNNLGAIFGGAGSRFPKESRSIDLQAERRESSESSRRAPSVDRVAISSDDARGEPSVAISNTLASGHVDPPEALRDLSPTTPVDYISPTSSRSSEVNSPSQFVLPGFKEQIGTGTTRRPSTAPAHERRVSIVPGLNEAASQSSQQDTRRRLDIEKSRDRPASAVVFDTGTILPGSYPPSPDEVIFFNKQLEDDAHRQRAAQETLLPASYHSLESSSTVIPAACSSSDDYFTSEVSRPTSVPSVPSIISADSSVMAEDILLKMTKEELLPQHHNIDQAKTPTLLVKASPVVPALAMEDEAGYNGDGDGAHEEEEDDSDSDEDFLSMPKSRSRDKSNSDSVSIPELSRGRARSGTQIADAMKTDESGSSTGTVKKVRRAIDQAEGEEVAERGRTLSK